MIPASLRAIAAFRAFGTSRYATSTPEAFKVYHLWTLV